MLPETSIDDRCGKALALGDGAFGGERRRDAFIGAVRAVRASVVSIAALEAEDDEQQDDPADIAGLHAASSLTTPSRVAMRRAAAAPELRAPSI